MTNRIYEIATGFSVLIIALASVWYFYNTNTPLGDIKNNYVLIAHFRAIEGIRADSNVCIAGVCIGKVHNLSLNKETFMAKVQIKLPQHIRIAEDSKICVRSEGLLGNRFLEIKPGASKDYLEANDEIFNTQSAVSFEDLFSKMMFSNRN